MPLVSIIIPTRNRVTLLREAVASALLQDYPRKEIIVVDDGSNDGTEEFCAGLPVQHVRLTGKGRSTARNLGVSKASGELLAFLDDDDLWPEGSLAARVRRWKENPECHHVVGRVRRFRGNPDGSLTFLDREDEAHHMVGLGAEVMLRGAFEAAGGFDESLDRDEDADLWFRMREEGMKVTMIPEICLHYRRHDGNTTSDHEEISCQHASLLRALHRKLRNTRLSPADQP